MSRKGHPLSAATRAKISAALKGRKRKGHKGSHKGHHLSPATRAKISAALKGRHHAGHHLSAAARAKISAALKGKKHPHKGHHLSPATRAKISAALKARHPGAVHTATTHTGRHLSPETRAKISAALKGRKRPKGTHATATSIHHPRRGNGVRRAHLNKARPVHHSAPRTSKRRHHWAGKSLISAHTRHTYKGFLKRGIRHKRTRIVIHRRVRAHRVWRRRRRR